MVKKRARRRLQKSSTSANLANLEHTKDLPNDLNILQQIGRRMDIHYIHIRNICRALKVKLSIILTKRLLIATQMLLAHLCASADTIFANKLNQQVRNSKKKKEITFFYIFRDYGILKPLGRLCFKPTPYNVTILKRLWSEISVTLSTR